MMVVVPKRISDMEDELKGIITADVYSFAYERGVKLGFISDSRDIHDSINTITSRTVYLIENTKPDHLLLESMKGVKEMQKAVGE